MKKSLNENIRIEFREILENEEYQEFIRVKKLDQSIIAGALEKLIKDRGDVSAFTDEIESTRSEFENYIVNTLKTKQHSS